MHPNTLWPAAIYLAGILLVAGLAIAVFLAVRRWMLGTSRAGEPAGLTLGEARQLRENGVLSPQEFDQIKRAILSAAEKSGGESPGQVV